MNVKNSQIDLHPAASLSNLPFFKICFEISIISMSNLQMLPVASVASCFSVLLSCGSCCLVYLLHDFKCAFL